MSSKQVKVYKYGEDIGRKVCIRADSDFSMLASDLDDMFGPGLKLFRKESEFNLLYKDRENYWKSLDDVTWSMLVERVTRLRIAKK
ncbi:auxin-responsive protein IAA32-like [Jatropha curcas]|uniref:auxin-responsive protein IAA32-like n=1 Tax=Jatropha curcas TaxID=180498 RepID=UPI0009D6FE2B|nr:auxin-responsive protein IAA32-like [Jatropha curcas]